jgi:hypothetical protein
VGFVKVLLRQEAEKVYEALVLLQPMQYRHRVVVGIFLNLLQLIATGNMPYGILLGYIIQSGCSSEVHEHKVAGRSVTFVLPKDVDMPTVASQGSRHKQQWQHCHQPMLSVNAIAIV